jgi:hypothetical protein
MTEYLKSFSSMSLALALLPVRQIQTMLGPSQTDDGDDDPGVRAMDAITSSAIQNFGGSLLRTFCALDNAQRRAIAIGARIFARSRDRASRRSTDWSWPAESAVARRTDFCLRL